MQVAEKKELQNSTVELQIVVSAEEFEAGIVKAYNKNKNKIAVPGFRKGKATRKMIESYYGEGVFWEDAVNATYGDAYEAAIKETGLKVIDNPDVEIIKLDKDGYTFKAVVAVAPEVKLGEYKGLKVTKKVEKVTAKDVEAELNNLRQRNSRLVNVTDRPVQKDDTVVIDYSGSVNGEKFAGGTAEKQDLVIGSGQFIPGFEDQIIGKNIGDEFDVNVKFPEEYHAPELSGKDAVFAVKLHEIKFTELPELDDEFVKDVSSEFDTLDAFKADIKKKKEEANEKAAESKLEDDLVDLVVEGMEVDMPAVLVERQLDSICNEFNYRLQSQGLEFNTYLQMIGMTVESFRDNYKEQAEKRAKVNLAIDKIIELEGFTADDEAVEKEYADLAQKYGMEVDKVKGFVPAEDLKHDMFVSMAIELLKKEAVVTKPAAKKCAKKAEAAEAPAAEAECEEKPAKKPAAKKTTTKKTTAKKAEEKAE